MLWLQSLIACCMQATSMWVRWPTTTNKKNVQLSNSIPELQPKHDKILRMMQHDNSMLIGDVRFWIANLRIVRWAECTSLKYDLSWLQEWIAFSRNAKEIAKRRNFLEQIFLTASNSREFPSSNVKISSSLQVAKCLVLTKMQKPKNSENWLLMEHVLFYMLP